MIVKPIGAYHAQGVSKKTGRPYNCTVVTVAYPTTRSSGRGMDTETIWLDAQTYPAESIQLETEYDAQYNRYGHIVSFERK